MKVEWDSFFYGAGCGGAIIAILWKIDCLMERWHSRSDAELKRLKGLSE